MNLSKLANWIKSHGIDASVDEDADNVVVRIAMINRATGQKTEIVECVDSFESARKVLGY